MSTCNIRTTLLHDTQAPVKFDEFQVVLRIAAQKDSDIILPINYGRNPDFCCRWMQKKLPRFAKNGKMLSHPIIFGHATDLGFSSSLSLSIATALFRCCIRIRCRCSII